MGFLEHVGKFMDYGAWGVLALGFLVVLRWMMTTQRDAMEAMRQEMRANTAATLALQQMLLAHDLTVTGLNPATGADVEERTNRAYTKYLEIQKTMTDLRHVLVAQVNANPVAPPRRSLFSL